MRLPRLFHLGVDLGLFDLGQLLAFAHVFAFDDVEVLEHAADLERQANLVLVDEQAVGADRRRGRPVDRRNSAHRRWPGRRFFCGAVAAGDCERAAQRQDQISDTHGSYFSSYTPGSSGSSPDEVAYSSSARRASTLKRVRV